MYLNKEEKIDSQYKAAKLAEEVGGVVLEGCGFV